MAESQQVTGHRPQPVGNGGLWTVNGSPIQTMKRKLASLAFQCLAYAIAGYAFFLIFFRSQF